jgi:hypothetical protein
MPTNLTLLESARMSLRLAAVLLFVGGLRGCLTYEYEHEFWLKVDGSGTVYVTGRPDLWAVFKGVGPATDADGTATRDAVRAVFERSGLRVNRLRLTRRRGRPYVFVSADFDDVNRLSGSPAFPDLALRLTRQGDRLRLEGGWHRPTAADRAATPGPAAADRDGLMAVRFHLPSKIYEHSHAADGVERGNIVGWRQELADAIAGRPLDFAVLMDERSILFSTVALFGTSVVLALLILASAFALVARRGRKGPAAGSGPPVR